MLLFADFSVGVGIGGSCRVSPKVFLTGQYMVQFPLGMAKPIADKVIDVSGVSSGDNKAMADVILGPKYIRHRIALGVEFHKAAF